MLPLSGLIQNQGKLLLSSRKQAVLYAVALALFPYSSWLSCSVIALVALRKSVYEGGVVLLYAMAAHLSLSMIFGAAISTALINTLLTFVPCYLAACTLRLTMSWRFVSGVFFLQTFIVMAMIQLFAPDFILNQFQFILTIIKETQTEGSVFDYLNTVQGETELIFAHYVAGIQAIGVVLTSSVSLMLARAVQSALYYPGGFKQEMLQFRGDKTGGLLFIAVLFAVKQDYLLAIDLLPILMFYFTLVGVTLGFQILYRKKAITSFLFLIIPLILIPYVMFPLYIILGSLDSFFNFRMYLQRRAD